jgi:ubiquinol-cytochrome c reductase cytochrome b subunit
VGRQFDDSGGRPAHESGLHLGAYKKPRSGLQGHRRDLHCFCDLVCRGGGRESSARKIGPTDTAYTPRPDWYFLFLFEILKYCERPLETVGSTVLPAIAITTLLLVPFIDRKAARKWTQRTTAFGVVGMAALGWTALTVAAIVTTPPPKTASEVVATEVSDWRQLSPESLAGLLYYRREQCSSCHNLTPGPKKVGPDLATASVRRTPAWMIMHFKNAPGLVPGSAMPPVHLEDAQLVALAAFLKKPDGEERKSD